MSDKYINTLESQYEQLLEDLPQEKFSYVGAPPELVIKEVEKNIYIKNIVRDDIKDLLEESCTIEDLKINIGQYFEI